jgi:hypothetical protein
MWPHGAAAQTSLQIPLQFDFVDPGAKSLALAGAFAGVADDATASYANPAGLTFLEDAEVSAELRGFRVTTPFMSGGRLSGTVSGIGIDTVAGPSFSDSIGSHVGLGYLSLVYPHPSRQWVIAGYRHELARIDQGFESSGVFQQDPAEFTSRRDLQQDVQRTIAITGYGATAAFKATRTLSVGGGIAVYRFSIDSQVDRYLSDGFFGPVNKQSLSHDTVQRGDDTAIAPTIGTVFDRGSYRLGAVFRAGPSFRYDTVGGGLEDLGTRFRVPHTLAAGASKRTAAGLLFAAEVTRIWYSRLRQDFVTSQAQGEGPSFTIDDSTEVHASVQYPLRRASGPPIRLRVGTWYDPDHSVKFTPAEAPVTVSDRLFDERLSVALSKGAGQLHLAGGVGMTLSERLELNAAFDVSSRHRIGSASMIVHLRRGALP